MLSPAISFRNEAVKPAIPDFVATYKSHPLSSTRMHSEPILIICPLPPSRIRSTASLQQYMLAVKLAAITPGHSPTDVLKILLAGTAAQLTKASRQPSRSSALTNAD